MEYDEEMYQQIGHVRNIKQDLNKEELKWAKEHNDLIGFDSNGKFIGIVQRNKPRQLLKKSSKEYKQWLEGARLESEGRISDGTFYERSQNQAGRGEIPVDYWETHSKSKSLLEMLHNVLKGTKNMNKFEQAQKEGRKFLLSDDELESITKKSKIKGKKLRGELPLEYNEDIVSRFSWQGLGSRRDMQFVEYKDIVKNPFKTILKNPIWKKLRIK